MSFEPRHDVAPVGDLEPQRPADPASRRRALFPTATDAEWHDWKWQLRHSVRDAKALREGRIDRIEITLG